MVESASELRQKYGIQTILEHDLGTTYDGSSRDGQTKIVEGVELRRARRPFTQSAVAEGLMDNC